MTDEILSDQGNALGTEQPPSVVDQGKALADSIAAHLVGAAPGAIVQINPTNPAIPPIVAANIAEFLRRVKGIEGLEAIAWAEAYTYVCQFTQKPEPGIKPTAPGVPFTGLPAAKA